MDQLTLATAFKMTVALGIVLLTFGAAIFLARKFSGNANIFAKKGARSSVKPLEVLAFQSLGPGKNLYLIRCLDKKVLVGATNAQITQVLTIADDEENEEVFHSTLQEKLPTSVERAAKNQFSESFKEFSRI